MPFEPLPAGYLLDNRYRIEKVIGEGGMGRVYLARDTRLSDRAVAVKEMIVGDALHERKAIEDFNRERDLLARLSHPGIPGIIDYLVVGQRHYLVMEYISGGDLQSRLDKLGPKGRFPEKQVLVWARQILEILIFLHEQKPPIIYRDLKPANIMIDENGRAMLIDFGIARFLPPGGRGTQIGSVGYAPPEQYLGNVEPRSDLYALGATMHHLLTGRDPQLEPPFSFPPVRQLAPEVSEQTERVVMQALEQDINKRPPSARAMLAMLPDPEKLENNFVASSVTRGDSNRLSSTAITPPSSHTLTRSSSKTPVKVQSGIPVTPTSKEPTRPLPPKPSSGQVQTVSPTAKTAELPNPGASTPSSTASSGAARAQGYINRQPSTNVSQAKPVSSSAASNLQAAVGHSKPTGSSGRYFSFTQAQRSRARLIVHSGELVEFPLNGNCVIVGRKTSAADHVDIDLSCLKTPKSQLVSRKHAEIIKQADGYYIRDLGSSNGTYIVGKGRLGRDQLYKLKDRDKIAFASITCEFRET